MRAGNAARKRGAPMIDLHVHSSASDRASTPELNWRGMAFTSALVVAICLVCGCLKDGGAMAGENASYAALRAENEALRRENQLLRRELISKNGALPDSVMPEKGVARDGGMEPAEKETGYWLSSKTKVRHNSRCRNYRRVKGYPCGPNDGRPCKTCGG